MSFDYKNLTYKVMVNQKNYPIQILAIYEDGDFCKTCWVPFDTKNLDEAIHQLKKELGHPKAVLTVDTF